MPVLYFFIVDFLNFFHADSLPQRSLGRMATKATKISVPLHKKISVEKRHDIEQPLRGN